VLRRVSRLALGVAGDTSGVAMAMHDSP